MRPRVRFEDIKDEVSQIRKTHFALKDDSAFVLWFLRAFLTDTEEDAVRALTGKSKDKGIDAILVDPRAQLVHLVQGKFRDSLGEHAESRNDVLQFAALSTLPERTKEELEAYYAKLDPLARSKVEQLIHCVRRNGYQMCLYYVTTGRCSPTIRNEAREHTRQAERPVDIYILDAEQIKSIFDDYLKGVAPAVPSLLLPIAAEGSIRAEGTIHRFDSEKEIESWVFSMSARDVGEMSRHVGIRLFARNVRGYLGADTKINEAMAQTIKEEPDNFWYYNNGVTIVCDNAKRETQGGQDVLRVDRPQVINGQQTTRTLEGTSSSRASVLVRVIKIPRKTGDEDHYDDLVSAIVRATNWQNAIVPSDLISNDHIQVYLERELRKRGYQYLRKRQSRAEARRSWGNLKRIT
jgi:AIPR protein